MTPTIIIKTSPLNGISVAKEGLSNSEAATCLQISENNTKVKLYRAKTLLKEKLYDLTERTKIYEFGNNRCDELVSRVMSRI